MISMERRELIRACRRLKERIDKKKFKNERERKEIEKKYVEIVNLLGLDSLLLVRSYED
jgi:hypothetical protein